MVQFNINNLTGNVGATNFDSLLTQARGQLDKISQQIQGLINQQSFGADSVTQDAGGIKIQVPQLADILTGQQGLTLKTSAPVDRNLPLEVQVQNSNVVIEQGKPILKLEGQIIQNTSNPNTPAAQKFTAEVPLTNQGLQNLASGNLANQVLNTSDQVVRNFLPSSNVNAFTNNLSDNLRALLPQNLQGLNLTNQNNLNLQISSFTTPSGEQIVVDQNASAQNIKGTVEVFPEAKESLIRTEFGTFRVSNLTQLPNGSTINFTILGRATTTPQAATENILNLNPTNIQALRLSLEATDSPLQNLLRSLNSSQAFAPNVQRFFPHPDDKSAYARQLMFLSGAVSGAPENWLGEDGQMMVNNIQNIDNNFHKLQEVFGVLQNFAGKGDQKINAEWNSYIVPFYDGSKLSFVTIQVQRDPEGTPQQTTKGKRKFVIELEQDKLGRTAIEGLYSKVEGKVNNLDIIMKTENAVDDEFSKELSQIFNETALAYNYAGTISFAAFAAQTPLYTDISKILGDGIVI